MRARTGDVFYAYVNLDPTKPPTEVMLQFYTVGETMALWLGTPGLLGRQQHQLRARTARSAGPTMGALPATGQWVRLEVPASKVGLEGKIVEGMAFSL